MTEGRGERGLPVAHRCEGYGRYVIPCKRTTLHPSRTCPDHRNQAGYVGALYGHDQYGEWRIYTFPTPSGWGVTEFRVINGGDYGYKARRRYTKELPDALAMRDRWAADLSGISGGPDD